MALSPIWVSESSDDSDDGYAYEPETTLRSIEKSRTINFSIRATYTNWEPREAFRELVQNWRDGIIKSFNLAEKDFQVIREEKRISNRKIEIVYKVPSINPDRESEEWLGYIHFKGCDGEGTVEITNRAATLQPWHLDLGGTGKTGDVHQAGAHGEGLKIALLVFMRGQQNNNVKCRSGGFNWNYNFTTRGCLVARLRRMNADSIQNAESLARRQSQKGLLPFGARPTRDVQFVIGTKHQGRDEMGHAIKRSPVKLEDFRYWTTAALFLHDATDGETLLTEHGDFLTSPQLSGNIYLKGLLLYESTLLRSASITNRPLKFGYNFAFGRTNRERESVAGADEESKAILEIWSKVLVANPEMVQKLSDMLNDNETEYADVFGAKKMNFETTSRLKDHLFKEEGKWYYCAEDKSSNPRLHHIIQGLGCKGVELTKLYWNILRRHHLIRTAEEEERRRFTAAPPVAVPQNIFAASVHHLLRACVRACHQTEGTAISFVQAGTLHLQLFFSDTERMFRMHERWLDPDSAIAELGLPETLAQADVVFHAVKRLFWEALEQLPRSEFLDEGDGRAAEWRRKLEISLAEQRLLNYFRMWSVTIGGPAESPGLWVKWTVDVQRNNQMVEVQCHRASSCSHLRDSLLIAKDADSDKMACIAPGVMHEPDDQAAWNEVAVEQPHTCRVCRESQPEGQHHEVNLQQGEEYFFVLVLRDDPYSIVLTSSVKATARPITPPPRLPAMPPRSTENHNVAAIRATQPLSTSEGTPRRSTAGYANSWRLTSNNTRSEGYVASSIARARSSSPESASVNVDEGLSPANVPSIEQEPTGASESLQTGETAPVGLFSLGHRLQSLDIFEIDADRWYEAKSSENVRAVIGIVKGQKPLPQETRKRQRRGQGVRAKQAIDKGS